jgi:signal peptidase II
VLKPETKRIFWLIGVAVVIVAADQTLKAIVVQALEPAVSYPVIDGLLNLYLIYNDSAAFSIGFGATFIFTILSTGAALALLWFRRRMHTVSWAVLAGCLLGGVVGNLVDRLMRPPSFGSGLVVDYIQIPFNFPIFNLADVAIFVATSLTVIRVLKGHKIGQA